jgi:hypothetical protein
LQPFSHSLESFREDPPGSSKTVCMLFVLKEQEWNINF